MSNNESKNNPRHGPTRPRQTRAAYGSPLWVILLWGWYLWPVQLPIYLVCCALMKAYAGTRFGILERRLLSLV